MATGAWIVPDAHDERRWHAVADVVDGCVVLACRGRCAISDVLELDTSPPAAERCVRCELDRDPETRVRISFDFDTSDIDVGGEA